jgi:hypothetical protein
MTIFEIEQSLPNGFHDASLKRIDIDYVSREANLDIEVQTGSLEDSTEDYRLGRLTLSGFLFCIIESPDPQYVFEKTEGLWIADSGLPNSMNHPIKLSTALPEGAFTHYFFINEWNSFIFLSAMEAHFKWL